VYESNILLFPPPTCIGHTVAILLYDYWAVNHTSSTPLSYAINHTRLAITISCKGQAQTRSLLSLEPAQTRRRVNMYIYLYLYLYIYIHIHIHTYLYLYLSISISIPTSIYLYMYIYVYVCIYICVCVCMCMYRVNP